MSIGSLFCLLNNGLMKEEEIIRAIAAGGRQQEVALKALYRKGAEFRRYFNFKMGLSPQIAEDLLQETIVKIFRAAPSYTGGQGFGDSSANAWLWQMARNCALDFVRRNKPEEVPIENDDAKLSAEFLKVDAGGGIFSKEPRRLSAEECFLKGLEEFASSFPDRAIALEMQMDGESIDSISNRIGRTVGATKEFLSQCKKKLAPFIEHCLPLLN